jgi:hypothetical protein
MGVKEEKLFRSILMAKDARETSKKGKKFFIITHAVSFKNFITFNNFSLKYSALVDAFFVFDF